ncbi:hypothetical protein BCU90_07620 [Vibrio lentus]|uniref:glycosyltransferase family 2 protein n=1 Tax=Vibrio TaxID=662 RepID=UPI000C831649|nr:MULTISPECIES: glycosyltransferase family 2 protein [Vibrio]MDN2667520.1 glycosyltransferase [Vibrio sp. 14N.309.X.WAT.E.F5]PMG48446.1 hypothetical protein BCU90_07620 [Vibrio lentus]
MKDNNRCSKKVGIIIPTYNGSKYIVETINSCLEQSYKNIEIVVVDDCSTDDTYNLCQSHFVDKIRLIKNEVNSGLPTSINRGVNSIESDYFIYLGHDDLLPEEHVDSMLTEASGSESLIHCNSIEINEIGETFGLIRDDHLQVEYTKDIDFQISIYNFISVVGMLHKTSCFKDIGGWDERYNLYGEWLYYIKMKSVLPIKYTNKSRAFYRVHSTNISHSLRTVERLNSYYAYKEHCRNFARESTSFNLVESFRYQIHSIKEKLSFIKRKILIVINKG